MMDALTLKMVILTFNVLFLPGCSSFLESLESRVCTSKNDALSCICKNREDFSLNPRENFAIRLIQVSGCGVVEITFGAVTHLRIEKIVFSDIHTLIIKPFAFARALSINTLQIENIETFNISTDGFSELLNVTNIIIRNITSMTVQQYGFGEISTVEHFSMERISLIKINRNAFILTNITSFKVTDSKIAMESDSFLIHNAEIVLFQNCSLEELKNRSFSMAYVDSVTFFDCNFGILNTNAIHLKYPEHVIFNSCSVSELNKYAFYLVDPVEGVKFIHNTIKFGKGSPLYLESATSSISIENKKIFIHTFGNYFLCNCDIYWIWISEEPFYDIKSSFCIGTNITLSDITPELDSYGNCTALEATNIKDSNQNVATNVQSSEVLIDEDSSPNVTTNAGSSVVEECESIYVSSQAVSAGTLLNMSLTSLIILFRLAVFMCSL